MPSNLVEHFSNLPDPRSDKNKQYALADIIVLSICAIVSGAEGWEAIEKFGKEKEDWLRQFIKLENGIPSHDCISWVFSRISPKKFQQCFINWTQSVVELTQGEIIAIDGKTARHSYDRRLNCPAIHMVNAWASQNAMSLGQVATAEKSNEITAIPELLELLLIKDCIVTIDAMGCQTAIAEQIIEKEADYVLAVKGNQGHLHEALVDYFDTAIASDFKDCKKHYFEELDHGHGRTEVRRYWLSSNLSTLPEPEKWAGLQSIGLTERECHEQGKVSIERRYYIVSFQEQVETFARAVRQHWGIENRLHWVLDVTFNEDDSRIRKGHAPENFNTLRQLALNLLRKEASKTSIKQKRFKAALSDDFRAKVVFQ